MKLSNPIYQYSVFLDGTTQHIFKYTLVTVYNKGIFLFKIQTTKPKAQSYSSKCSSEFSDSIWEKTD